MHLRFGETESAFDYMMATREYLEQHGKPLSEFYLMLLTTKSIVLITGQFCRQITKAINANGLTIVNRFLLAI